VTIVGYFCTGGYTEVGGIQYFLEKINPNIQWERCFPTALKPNPKFKRIDSAPCSEHSGVTGNDLVQKMLERIRHPSFEHDHRYDYILLIDDLDCRFYSKTNQDINEEIIDIAGQVEAALGRKVNFKALFASPEVEVWFVADWTESFGKEYPKYQHRLRTIVNRIIRNYISNIEQFGEPLENGSCKYKLSEIIQNGFSSYVRYSKRINGGSMLKRIRPEVVERMCRIYFSDVYWRLKKT